MFQTFSDYVMIVLRRRLPFYDVMEENVQSPVDHKAKQ